MRGDGHTMAGDREYEQCIKVNCFFAFLWYLTVKFKLLGMLALFHFCYLIMDLMLNGDFLFCRLTYFFWPP